MNALEYFIVTILIYTALNGIQALGLNMQFGLVGIYNFAYIVLVAVGAYATGVAALPPAPGGATQYIGGFGWIFPWDLLFGVGCTLVFALILSLICFSRISHWYLALTLSTIGNALLVLINNDRPLLNGLVGLIGIRGPGQEILDPGTFQFVFLGVSLAFLIFVYLLFRQVERSALGRAMRAVREDEMAARSLGKSALRIKMIAFLLGSGAAGLAGGLMAMYFGSWSPTAWLPGETFILLASVVVGGRGWGRGALIGSIIVLEGFAEGSRFLPDIGNVNLIPALQAICISLLLLGVLWWRPFGLVPEPKERFRPQKGEVQPTSPGATASALAGE